MVEQFDRDVLDNAQAQVTMLLQVLVGSKGQGAVKIMDSGEPTTVGASNRCLHAAGKLLRSWRRYHIGYHGHGRFEKDACRSAFVVTADSATLRILGRCRHTSLT